MAQRIQTHPRPEDFGAMSDPVRGGVAVRPPSTWDALSDLQEELSNIAATVLQLDERLTAVLRPNEPINKAPTADPLHTVQILQRISELQSTAEGIRNHLNSITDRLAV